MTGAKQHATLNRLVRQLQRIERSKRRDYETAKAELAQASALCHEFVAAHFEPILNAHVATMPARTLEEKQILAQHVNAEMRMLGVTLKTDDGEAAILRARPGRGYTDGRFQLELVGANRTQMKSSSKLFPLQLMGRPVESDAGEGRWRDRISLKPSRSTSRD